MRFLLSPCCYNTVLLASVRRWAGGSCGAAFGVNYLRSSLRIQAAAVQTAPDPGLLATWHVWGAKPAPASLHPEPAWGKGLKTQYRFSLGTPSLLPRGQYTATSLPGSSEGKHPSSGKGPPCLFYPQVHTSESLNLPSDREEGKGGFHFMFLPSCWHSPWGQLIFGPL